MATKKNPEEIFNKAVEISDLVEREEYLDEACGGDDKLRADVIFIKYSDPPKI